MTLSGAGCGLTIIRSPASLPLSFIVSGYPNKAVVYAHDVTNARVEKLTIDGDDQGNGNYRFMGAAFYNAGGAITDVCIQKIEESPFSGTQHGYGVYANNTTGGPYALEVGNVTVTDFQKNGLDLRGAGLTANVHDCTVTGHGYTAITAQNGIVLGFGAGGSVSNCTISDMGYTPATYVASGLLAYQGAAVTATNIELTNVQAPVSWYDTDGGMTKIHTTGGADYGPIFVYNSTATPGASRGTQAAMRAHPRVQPGDDGAPLAASRGGDQTLSTFSVSVDASCLDGVDATGSVGIFAYSEGGPLAVTAENNEITNWDEGLVTFGGATTLTAHFNKISSNTTAGYDNLAGIAQDAENNWWGAADGPSGTGPGSGDAILGPAVDVTPFTTSGADVIAGCGFAPSPSVSIGDASGLGGQRRHVDAHVHDHAVRHDQPERDRGLADAGRLGDAREQRLRRGERDGDDPAEDAVDHGVGRRERRHEVRGRRDVLGRPVERGERLDRRRSGHRDDPERRRAADGLDRRRDDRGRQRRHHAAGVHGLRCRTRATRR